MSASRIGRKPVTIPSGVAVNVVNQRLLSIKGPKGEISLPIDLFVTIGVDNNQIKISDNPKGSYCRAGSGSRKRNSITGTTRAKISNIVLGVSKGYERKLTLVGVGYRAQAKGKILNLTLGFSHPINYELPAGITVDTPSQTEIIVKGIDRELVGQVAAKIRAYRGPEPYKGKGIRYADEVVQRKETKKK